jgi:hypothetical protein
MSPCGEGRNRHFIHMEPESIQNIELLDPDYLDISDSIDPNVLEQWKLRLDPLVAYSTFVLPVPSAKY